MKKPSKKSKRKPKSTAKIIDDCAVLMQKLVRLKAADHNGYCKCITCGKVQHWTVMHGAHYIERGKTATKVMEQNIHPSCQYCNMIGDKHIREIKDAYSKYMRDRYGDSFVDELFRKSKEVKKYGIVEARSLYADLKNQVKEAEQRVEQLRPTQEDGY